MEDFNCPDLGPHSIFFKALLHNNCFTVYFHINLVVFFIISKISLRLSVFQKHH